MEEGKGVEVPRDDVPFTAGRHSQAAKKEGLPAIRGKKTRQNFIIFPAPPY